MTFLSRLAVAACLCVPAAAPLHAANLLANPTFDSNSTGWTLQSVGTGAYSGWQATIGRGGSGGIYLTANLAGSASNALQCVNIGASTIDAHIHATQDYAPSKLYYGEVRVSTFDVPNCTATYITTTLATPHVLADGWVLHRIDGLELPPGTQSVMLVVMTTASGGSTSLQWDDAAVGPAGSTDVPPLPANLLLNPDFHSSLYRWGTTYSDGGYVIWTGSAGDPAPGAVTLQRSYGAAQSASQCVRLPGGAIDAYALSRGLAGDPAELAVSFHAAGNCSAAPLATPIALKAPSPGAWTLHHLLDHTPPAGATSALVQLRNNGVGSATMDHAAFGAAGSIDAPSQHSIGGSVSGLVGSHVQLRLNDGETIIRTSDGAFTFATPVIDGGVYAVTISQSPSAPAQTCSISHGAGTIAGADVTDVEVTCDPPIRYGIGGTVMGLAGHSLTLGLNGIENLPVAADGSFEFDTRLLDGESYAVTVLQPPLAPMQACTVTRGSGKIAGADAQDIDVHCVTPWTSADIFANGFE